MAFTKYPTRSAAASALKINYNLPSFEEAAAYLASAIISQDGTIIFDAELLKRGDVTHGADVKALLGISKKAQAVAYAATITPNINLGTVINVGTITGAITIAAPTGTPVDGQEITFRFVQDGTGHAFTWNSVFVFSTESPSSNIVATASAKSEGDFRWNATDSKWRCVKTNHGY